MTFEQNSDYTLTRNFLPRGNVLDGVLNTVWPKGLKVRCVSVNNLDRIVALKTADGVMINLRMDEPAHRSRFTKVQPVMVTK